LVELLRFRQRLSGGTSTRTLRRFALFLANITTGRIRNGLPFDGFHKHELILKGYFGVVLNVAVWPGTGFDKININTERFKVG
jgi:hypothetical protein